MIDFSIQTAERLAGAMEMPDWVLEKSAAVTFQYAQNMTSAFETWVKVSFPLQYQYVEQWIRVNRHPFSHRLPYMSPWHVIFSILAYFGLILLFRIGAPVIGKRSCRLLGLVHNLGLHALSMYMSVGLLVSARAAGYSLWNNAAGTSAAEWRIAKFIWLFYVSKVVEWVDTLIMLLKQNYHQVSFLHVYHHTTIFFIWWLACLLAPGGEAYYSAMVNSGVHVVMYGYYFLTLLFPTGAIRSVLNKFKFIITKGQMTQFTFNCFQSAYDLVIVPRVDLKYSASLLQILFWYMISLLVLFGNFLSKNSKAPRGANGKCNGIAEQSTSAAKDGTAVPSTNGNGEAKRNAVTAAKEKCEVQRQKQKQLQPQLINSNSRSAQPLKSIPVFKK